MSGVFPRAVKAGVLSQYVSPSTSTLYGTHEIVQAFPSGLYENSPSSGVLPH